MDLCLSELGFGDDGSVVMFSLRIPVFGNMKCFIVDDDDWNLLEREG